MALTFLEDIESDMSVFHRIDDVRAMPAQRFIDLMLRLPFYRGAMRDIVQRIAERLDESPSAPTPAALRRGRDGQEVTEIPGDLESIATAEAFDGLFEVSIAREEPADGGQGVQAS